MQTKTEKLFELYPHYESRETACGLCGSFVQGVENHNENWQHVRCSNSECRRHKSGETVDSDEVPAWCKEYVSLGTPIKLLDILKTYGVNGVEFELEMEVLKQCFIIVYSDGHFEKMRAVIDEDRYKARDNYKITLAGMSASGKFGRQHFYMSDLQSRIDDGHVRVIIKELKQEWA